MLTASNFTAQLTAAATAAEGLQFTHAAHVSFANSHAQLKVDSAHLLTFSVQRLAPYFSIEFGQEGKAGLPGTVVLGHTNPLRLQTLLAKFLAQPQRISLQLPSQRRGGSTVDAVRTADASEDVQYVYYPSRQVLVSCHRANATVEVVGLEIEETALEIRALLKDNILQQAEQRRGSLMLHASAVAFADSGILALGPKGAGKTTFLASCLKQVSGVEFVSNDIVFADSDHKLYGWPEPIAISEFTCSFAGIESENLRQNVRTSQKKLTLPYLEVPRFFNRELRPSIPARALVLPRTDLNQLTQLRESNVVRALPVVTKEVFAPGSEARPTWASLDRTQNSEPSITSQLVNEFVSHVAIFELLIGHNFASECQRILNTIVNHKRKL